MLMLISVAEAGSNSVILAAGGDEASSSTLLIVRAQLPSLLLVLLKGTFRPAETAVNVATPGSGEPSSGSRERFMVS